MCTFSFSTLFCSLIIKVANHGPTGIPSMVLFNMRRYSCGGGPDNVFPLFKQRISQRFVRTSFEKQLDPRVQLLFEVGGGVHTSMSMKAYSNL